MPLTVSDVKSFKPSARSYKWDVKFSMGEISDPILEMRCTTSDLPQPDYNIIKTNFRNGWTLPESGAVTWNDLNFTVVEVDSWEVLEKLYALGKQNFDHEDSGAQIENPEDNLTITMNRIDNSPAKNFQLIRCVLSNYSPDQLNSDLGTVINITFTVAYLTAKLV